MAKLVKLETSIYPRIRFTLEENKIRVTVLGSEADECPQSFDVWKAFINQENMIGCPFQSPVHLIHYGMLPINNRESCFLVSRNETSYTLKIIRGTSEREIHLEDGEIRSICSHITEWFDL